MNAPVWAILIHRVIQNASSDLKFVHFCIIHTSNIRKLREVRSIGIIVGVARVEAIPNQIYHIQINFIHL